MRNHPSRSPSILNMGPGQPRVFGERRGCSQLRLTSGLALQRPAVQPEPLGTPAWEEGSRAAGGGLGVGVGGAELSSSEGSS